MNHGSLDVLLEKLSGGDLRAAEQIFRTYQPYLCEVVRRQLPDRFRSKFDSGDVVQSVWVYLLHGFRAGNWHFTNTEQLRAFLIKVTRHRLTDRLRHFRTAGEREQPLSGADLVAKQPRPSEVAQADELWEKMLALCPPGHRELLRLKRQGLSLVEIAARTGLHEGSVRRILRQLAGQLAARQEALPGPGAENL
jgi:RNA polymerase sigma-70 factor (ECF subfamily)